MPTQRFSILALLLALTIAGCATRQPETIPPPQAPPQPSTKTSAAKVPKRVPPPAPSVKPDVMPPAAAPQLLSPDIAEQHKDRIESDVTAMIEHTEELVARVHLSRLTTQQSETYSTIQSFISKAREAIQEKDMPRAQNLAEKAHALAQDLPARRE